MSVRVPGYVVSTTPRELRLYPISRLTVTVKLNHCAFENANGLNEEGKFVADEREAWSEHHPSTRKRNLSNKMGLSNTVGEAGPAKPRTTASRKHHISVLPWRALVEVAPGTSTPVLAADGRSEIVHEFFGRS